MSELKDYLEEEARIKAESDQEMLDKLEEATQVISPFIIKALILTALISKLLLLTTFFIIPGFILFGWIGLKVGLLNGVFILGYYSWKVFESPILKKIK